MMVACTGGHIRTYRTYENTDCDATGTVSLLVVDDEGTGSTGYCFTYHVPEIVELPKVAHVHPWMIAPKKESLGKRRADKVRPAVFDRRPFLNAYKAGRSLGA